MALPEWYRSACAASSVIAERRVFFVMGCQKSGTTWVAGLLDAHPEVCCRGEGHLSDLIGPMVEQAARLYNEDGRTAYAIAPEAVFSAARLLADHVLGQYLAESGDPAAVRCLGDRTPEAAIGMPALAALYPQASFIHVIRDGRDAAVSGWAHLKRRGTDDKFPGFAEYAGYFAAGHWVPYIRRARQAASTLAPDRYCEVRYEDLHAEPAAQARRLLAFLGVDAGPGRVSACVERGSFASLSGGREPGEEDSASHFRKGIVGDWANHFDAEAQRRFNVEGEAMLRELGYPETVPGTVFGEPASASRTA